MNLLSQSYWKGKAIRKELSIRYDCGLNSNRIKKKLVPENHFLRKYKKGFFLVFWNMMFVLTILLEIIMRY